MSGYPKDPLFQLLESYITKRELAEEVWPTIKPFYEMISSGRGFVFAPPQELDTQLVLQILTRLPEIGPIPSEIVTISVAKLPDLDDTEYLPHFVSPGSSFRECFQDALINIFGCGLIEEISDEIRDTISDFVSELILPDSVYYCLLNYIGSVMARKVDSHEGWDVKAQAFCELLEVVAKGFVLAGVHRDDSRKFVVVCA